MDMYEARRIDRWDAIRKVRTPLVAAVSGYCLGGGNELAMACDLIVASETARFGQPETGLGIIPGAGGTQRLPRLCGAELALRLCTDGRPIPAGQALTAGLVDRVVDRDLRGAVPASSRPASRLRRPSTSPRRSTPAGSSFGTSPRSTAEPWRSKAPKR